MPVEGSTAHIKTEEEIATDRLFIYLLSIVLNLPSTLYYYLNLPLGPRTLHPLYYSPPPTRRLPTWVPAIGAPAHPAFPPPEMHPRAGADLLQWQLISENKLMNEMNQ